MRLENVTANFTHEGGKTCFLQQASCEIPQQRLALRGEEKEKNAFIDLLLRRVSCEAGRILNQPLTSFPLGRMRPFLHPLNGFAMVQHLTALYGGNVTQNTTLFETLLSDKTLLSKRLDHWPLGLLQEFSLIAGLIGQFELYILEAVPENMSESFARNYWPYLHYRLEKKTVIVNLRDKGFIKRFCEAELVLEGKQLVMQRKW